MTYSERMAQKRRNEQDAEAKGLIADSMDVRMALMEKFHRGEATLEEVQSELAAIKRAAKKNGQVTRNQARNGRY